MPGRPLIVHVEDPATGASWDYILDQGPALLGRDESAAVRIERAYVSGQHGSFSFDDENATYLDLDSRTGSRVDGVICEPDQAVPLTDSSVLAIGPLRLRISRTAPAPAVGENPFGCLPGSGPALETDVASAGVVEEVRRALAAGSPGRGGNDGSAPTASPAQRAIPVAAHPTSADGGLPPTMPLPLLSTADVPRPGHGSEGHPLRPPHRERGRPGASRPSLALEMSTPVRLRRTPPAAKNDPPPPRRWLLGASLAAALAGATLLVLWALGVGQPPGPGRVRQTFADPPSFREGPDEPFPADDLTPPRLPTATPPARPSTESAPPGPAKASARARPDRNPARPSAKPPGPHRSRVPILE